MSGGQIAALIVAVLLLLWAGTLLFFGIGFVFVHAGILAILLLLPAGVILATAGLLFWGALRGGNSQAMSGGRIASVIVAFVLLPPSGAGLLIGAIFARTHFDYVLLPLTLAVLGLAFFLLWLALRKRPQNEPGATV